jgi:hypothetical protein
VSAEKHHLEFKRIKKETIKAFLLVLEDGREEFIPKSQMIDNPNDYSAGDGSGSMEVTAWIANEKNL